MKRFIDDRIATMPKEHAWVMGGTKLPVKNKLPPNWVKAAIRRFDETALKSINELKPKDGNFNMADLMQLLGIAQAQQMILQDPLASFPADAPELVKAAVVSFAEKVVEVQEPHWIKLAKALDRIQATAKPATFTQFQTNVAAYAEGAASAIHPDGTLAGSESAKAKLYQCLWFFWPMLDGIQPTAKLYEAVGSVCEEKFGWKTFEAVCGELRIFNGKRGRPRANIFLESSQQD